MIGERLKQARKASGLSMRVLAEQVDISAMAISKYENNKSTPSSGVLIALAEQLGVNVEYFFRQANIELKEVEYRKHSTLPKKTLSKIEGDVIEQIERFMELEQLLPCNPISRFSMPKGLPANVDQFDEIEAVAIKVRKAWGLGNNPIPDLIDTLEERGIKIFQSNVLHNDKFDGLAAQVNGTPVIVVGKDWPGDRQRFTLAHELGHLILSEKLDELLDDEKAANRFAGAFLVPESEVGKELGQTRNWLEPVELCMLKHSYGLSMRAWIYRASDLGILNSSASRKMWEHFRANNWVKTEPGEPYPSEQPKLFKQLVFHALAEDLVGDSKAAELLDMNMTQFRKLRMAGCCAPETINQ